MSRNRKPTADARQSAGRARWLRPLCLALATALVVATPLVPSERPELTGASLPLVMLWLLVALVWFAGAALLAVPVARFNGIDGLMLALAAWFGVSGLAMMWEGAPRLTVNAVWTWTGFAAAVLMLRQLLQNPAEIRALCAVLLGLAVCLSVAGIYQAAVVYPRDRALYEQDPQAAMRMAGVSAAEGTAQRKQFEDRLYSTEPTATFSLTNSLAGFLAPWLVLLLGVGASLTRQNRSWRRTGAAVLVAAILIGACLMLTRSRTAWLATAMGIGAIILDVAVRRLTRRHTWLAVFSFAGIFAAVGFLLLSGIVDVALFSQAALSMRYRFEYWQSTLGMIADRPLLGCGPGNFQQFYAQYKLPQASETVADPHNFLLEIAAVAGLPALVLLLALLGLLESGVFFSSWSRDGSQLATEKRTFDPISLRAIYLGGAAGIALAFFIGIITGYLPPLGAVLLGGAVAVAVVWLLDDWVRHAALPRWVILLAIGVLLVNLLAAGGVGIPGVAISLWALIAAYASGEAAFRSPGRTAALPLAGAAVAVVLLAACYFTAYRPVLLCSGHLARASEFFAAGHLDQALGEYRRAAAADRLSAEPPLQLAVLHFRRWIDQDAPAIADADYRQFQRGAEAALRLDRRAYPTHSAVGYLYLRAYDRTHSPECLTAALKRFQDAVALYPQDALAHAHLAWAARLAAAGSRIDPRRHAAIALHIDRLTPHQERKLENRRLWIEISTAALQDRLVTATAGMTAEQWMLDIRNKSE